ncbi:MAG: hypothetical protein ACR2HR_07720 [Euzebya sp.]
MTTTFTYSPGDGSSVSIDSPSGDALDVLGALSSMTEQITRWRRQAVAHARIQGRSWAEIGAALGMSRQAAWEQFSADIDTMLDEIRDQSDLAEAEAVALANDEIRQMRVDRRKQAEP